MSLFYISIYIILHDTIRKNTHVKCQVTVGIPKYSRQSKSEYVHGLVVIIQRI